MAKCIYIHFGIHRTGTTLLQKVMRHNRLSLRQNGVLYPELGSNSDNHGHIAWGLLRNKIPPLYLIEKLQEEIDNSIEKIVLSHEDFCLIQNNDWLRELKKFYEIKAIVYLRRQDLWLNSWYNQHIKWPWDKKFSGCKPDFFLDHYKEFYWIDYRKLLDKLENVIEKDNIYVNVVDSLGINDTTTNFLEYVKIDCVIPEIWTDVNASISAAKLDILRRIDLFSLKDKNSAKMKILKKLEAMKIDEDDGSTMVFSSEQIQFILNEFEISNKQVAQDYFNRDELFSKNTPENTTPCLVPDFKAYRKYIPMLLKEVASA